MVLLYNSLNLSMPTNILQLYILFFSYLAGKKTTTSSSCLAQAEMHHYLRNKLEKLVLWNVRGSCVIFETSKISH